MTLSVILCGPGLFIQGICLFVGCVANRPGLCVQSVSTFVGCISDRSGLFVEPCRIDVCLAFEVSALRLLRIGGGVPHILFCGCRAVPHFTTSFVRTAATIALSSCSRIRLVLFAAGFMVGPLTG